ncbi:MAG: hypothetical protein ABIG39_06335 [Candidatus Micrarchaeota archaeon]
MERKLLILSIIIMASCISHGQIVVGEVLTYPALVVESTENVTLSWGTNDLALSSINCTGPGVETYHVQVETEPTANHAFFLETNFTGEGILACTIVTFPINGTSVTRDYEIPIHCEGVRLELLNPSVRVAAYFTRPKGTGHYMLNTTIKVRNACVGLAIVSVSSTPPGGMQMAVKADDIYGLNVKDMPVTITVPDSMDEGVYQGTVRFSANGSTTTSLVNISVHWPGPTIRAKIGKGPSDINPLGNVRSGTDVVEYVEIEETMGYNAAKDVVCSVKFQDRNQEQQAISIGTVNPFGNGRCSFTMNFPDRNVRIGNYSVWIAITSNNSGDLNLVTNYTIPVPYILFAPTTIDLGKLTFDSGKDSSNSILTIIENGGFTPIENLKFELLGGSEGWISLPSCYYVPPGGRINCTFKISLSDNASIGPKEWVIGISSEYIQPVELTAKVEVYFIGVEDAIATLEAMSVYSIMDQFIQAETVKTNTVMMLEGIKESDISMEDTAIILSMYGGVESLLAQTERARGNFSSGDHLGAGRNLLVSSMALEKISSTYRSTKGNRTGALRDLGEVYTASASLWSASSEDVLKVLEAEAVASEKVSYRRAAEYYSLLADIYWQSNEDKSKAFSHKADTLGSFYSDSVIRAGEIKRNADRLFSMAREGTIEASGMHIVINPFSYDRTIENYRFALADYEAASKLYKSAGQQNELNIILSTLSAAEQEYEFVDRMFILGGVVLSLFLVLVILRVTVGMQRYREDEEDMEIGNVMLH